MFVLYKLEGLLPSCATLSFACVFAGIVWYSISTLPPADSKPGQASDLLNREHFRPVVLVTVGWSALYFTFLFAQNAAAFWVHKVRREDGRKKSDDAPGSPHSGRKPLEFADVKYGRERSKGGLIFTMDRTVGNMLEQSLPFLLGVWLYALTISPVSAAYYGWAWLGLRALYPIGFAQ